IACRRRGATAWSSACPSVRGPTKAFNGPATLRRLVALFVCERFAGRRSSVPIESTCFVIRRLLANPLRYRNLSAVNDIGVIAAMVRVGRSNAIDIGTVVVVGDVVNVPAVTNDNVVALACINCVAINAAEDSVVSTVGRNDIVAANER